MFKNVLRTFILSVMCVFAMSCTFISENTGDINFALPAARALQPDKQDSKIENITLKIALYKESGKVHEIKEKTLSLNSKSKVSFSQLPLGNYYLVITGETSTHTFSSGKTPVFTIYGGKETEVKVALKATPKENTKPEVPDPTPNPDKPNPDPETDPETENPDGPGPEPEIPEIKFKDLTVVLSNYENAVSLTYSLTPGSEKNPITLSGNSFVIPKLNIGTEYTVNINGISDTHYYSGSGTFVLKAESTDEVSIHLNNEIRNFDVSGTLTGVTNDAGNNVIVTATNKKTDISYTAVVTDNNSYLFNGKNQLPAGTYDISVSGGNNSVVYSGGVVDYVIDAAHITVSPIKVILTNKNQTGSISGKVTLPTDKAGLALTASAYNAITRSAKVGEGGTVNESGDFTITGLPYGSYKIEITGSNNKATFTGTSDVIDVNSSSHVLPNNISLKETKIEKEVNISFSNSFTGTPKLKVALKNNDKGQSYSKDNATASGCTFAKVQVGTYTLEVTGNDDVNTYTIPAASKTVTVTKDSVTGGSNIELTAEQIKGTISGNIKGIDTIPAGLTVTATKEGASFSKDGTITTGAKTYNITGLPVGKYNISISGETADATYSSNAASAEITANAKSPSTDITLNSTPKEVIPNPSDPTPSPSEITPDPAKGIYCVGGAEATDTENADGKKAFKTISGAFKVIGSKTNTTINILGDIVEDKDSLTQSIKLPNNTTIKVPEGYTGKVTSSVAFNLFELGSSITAVINGLEIEVTSDSSDVYALKMLDSAKLTLGSGTKVHKVGTDKKAIWLGSQGTLSLSEVGNLNTENTIKVDDGGIINVSPSFSSNGNPVKVFIGYGSANNRQLIKVDNAIENTSALKAVSKEFTIVGSNNNQEYVIGEDGKIKDKPKEPTTTYYVDSTAENDNGTGAETSKLKTIQAAVDKIVSKNKTSQVVYTIRVSGNGGKVAINNNGNPKLELTIEGVGQSAEINGAGKGVALDSGNSTDITLKNIKITNGTSSQGGGIYISSSSRVNLEDGVIISGNTDGGTEGGAGIYMGAGTSEVNSAILTLAGNVKISDEILLKIPNDYSTAKILVAGTLTCTTPCKIKLNNYTTAKGKPIIGISGSGALSGVENKFTIADTTYSIDNSGNLVDAGSATPGTVTAVGNFADLQKAVGNGGNIKLTQGFKINKTLNIANNVTIIADSGMTLTRETGFGDAFFVVSDTGALTIRGNNNDKLVFDGNNIDSASPLVVSYGELNIENCKLINNKIAGGGSLTNKQAHSGAIYLGNNSVQRQTANIINTEITSNIGYENDAGIITVEQKSDSKGYKVTIKDCNINNNTAGEGAILGNGYYVNDNTRVKPDIEIINSNISNNTSLKNGGGLYLTHSNVILDGAVIDGNKAKASGGGIFMNKGASVTIKNSTVLKNGQINVNGSGGKGSNLFVASNANTSLIIEKDGKQNPISISKDFAIDDQFDINWVQK